MVENPPLKTKDEQYPLLMVNGCCDVTRGNQGSKIMPSVWNVTSLMPKNTWRDRWPELLSACWMTSILLGISFLVFYVIGMLASNQQSFLLLNCNDTKPASDLYFHQVIPYRSYVPFIIYSDYLTYMAMKYPSLRINVIYLVEDPAFAIARQPGFYGKLMPPHLSVLHDEYNKREIKLFQKKFQNVNITVTHLSKYMAMTPLKYKWRTIPLSYLLFYARIFSVWQTGGVAIDLTTFNNRYNNHANIDKRLAAILKQHNDGIDQDEYAEIVNKIDREQKNEFKNMFDNLIDHILNETRSFFNSSLPFLLPPKAPTSKELQEPLTTPPYQSSRKKREVSEQSLINNETSKDFLIANENITVTPIDKTKNVLGVTNSTDSPISNLTNRLDSIINQAMQDKVNSSNEPGTILVVYDLSIGIGPAPKNPDGNPILGSIPPPFRGIPGAPTNFVPFPGQRPEISPFGRPEFDIKKKGLAPQSLFLESEGLFVAASGLQHPFLGRLMFGKNRRLHPKYAIDDALFSECGSNVDDVYCSNIFVI